MDARYIVRYITRFDEAGRKIEVEAYPGWIIIEDESGALHHVPDHTVALCGPFGRVMP